MNIRELLIKVGFDGGTTATELDKVDKKTDKVKRSFEALNGVLATLFTGGALVKIASVAEDMQNMDSRITSVTGSAALADSTMREMAAGANLIGIGVGEMGNSVARVIPAIQDFGMTAHDGVGIATNLAAALKANGASAAEAGAVLTQFSQALGSGVLQGDELRSIMEGAPNLYRDMAKAMGVTIAQFKKMSSDGKITSEWLAKFMLSNDKYTKQVAKMPKTIGYAWNTIKNDVSMAIWSVNKQGGVLATISNKILVAWDRVKKGADNLTEALGGPDGVVQMLKNCGEAVLFLGAAFATIKIASMLTSPFGVAVLAVAALAGAFIALKNDYDVWANGGMAAIDWSGWASAAEHFSNILGKVGGALEKMVGVDFTGWNLKAEIKQWIQEFGELGKTINGVLNVLDKLSSGDISGALGAAKDMLNTKTPKPVAGSFADVKDQLTTGASNTLLKPFRDFDAWMGWGPQQAVPDQTKPTGKQGWEDLPTTAPGVNRSTTTVSAPVTNTINAPITINAAPGMNTEGIAAQVRDQLSKAIPVPFNATTLQLTGGAH